jgi:hypothetical protein
MSILSLHCPHCHTENTSFYSAKGVQNPQDASLYTVLFICNKCSGGVVADLRSLPNRDPSDLPGDLRNISYVQILDIQPRATAPDIPEHAPDHIGNYYRQAARNLQRGDYDAAGMMCRKVLESTTRNLGETSGNLYQRIEVLAAKHEITPAMKEWAHAIRLDGNEAAHDDDPMEKDAAQDLLNFTELLLMYAYTLPGMLARRRERVAAS